MPSSILRPFKDKNEVWLYYTGWSRRLDVPYHNSIGLAISHDNGKTFKKYSQGPLISSSVIDPYFVGTPCVIKDGDLFRCWYYSSIGWFKEDDTLEPRYHLKYAESKDGINWARNGLVCIDFKSEEEGAICSPTVIIENGKYKMWFSYRGTLNYRNDKAHSYKIGKAESKDGLVWHRCDEKAEIEPSKKGWDNNMICYPNVIKHNKSKYMFYNGNNFGESGIGIAAYLE